MVTVNRLRSRHNRAGMTRREALAALMGGGGVLAAARNYRVSQDDLCVEQKRLQALEESLEADRERQRTSPNGSVSLLGEVANFYLATTTEENRKARWETLSRINELAGIAQKTNFMHQNASGSGPRHPSLEAFQAAETVLRKALEDVSLYPSETINLVRDPGGASMYPLRDELLQKAIKGDPNEMFPQLRYLKDSLLDHIRCAMKALESNKNEIVSAGRGMAGGDGSRVALDR